MSPPSVRPQRASTRRLRFVDHQRPASRFRLAHSALVGDPVETRPVGWPRAPAGLSPRYSSIPAQTRKTMTRRRARTKLIWALAISTLAIAETPATRAMAPRTLGRAPWLTAAHPVATSERPANRLPKPW